MHLFRPFPCAPLWECECGFKGKKRCQWGTRVPLKSFWSSNARWCSSRSKCHLQRYKAAGKEILKHTTMQRKSNGYVQQEYQIKKKKYPFTYRAPQKKVALRTFRDGWGKIVQNYLGVKYQHCAAYFPKIIAVNSLSSRSGNSRTERWWQFPCVQIKSIFQLPENRKI